MSLSAASNGTGSSSTATTKKEKSDEQFELEQQFILRMPAGEYATRLRDLVESGDEKIRERLFIDLNPETRRARVKFDETVFKGVLYDLPCITESYKSFDRKTLYKIADVAQILVCRLPGDLSSSDDDDDEDVMKKSSCNVSGISDGNEKKKKEKDKEKKYQWPHGITPPMKNVRKRRFRKVARQKTQDHDEIEKEVRRLFRADNEAADVKWEVIDDDQEIEVNKPIEQDPLEHDELFGGAVSESDEEDASQKGGHQHSQSSKSIDQTVFDGLFNTNLADLSSMASVAQMDTIEEENTDQLNWQQTEDLNLDDNTNPGGLPDEIRMQIEKYQTSLERLRNEKADLDGQVEQMTNPALRNILIKRVTLLQSEIEQVQMEYDQLING